MPGANYGQFWSGHTFPPWHEAVPQHAL
jgi:hypothetical protein